jgi:hypothetical protein
MFQHFSLSALQSKRYIHRLIPASVMPLKEHHVGLVVDDKRITLISAAFAKAKIINRIEQIRFAHAIIAGEAVHFLRELKIRLGNIFKVQYGNAVERHCVQM